MNDLEQNNMLQPLVDEIETAVSNAKKEIAEKVNSVITETQWDVRTLRRQMDSALFLRLATSRDKEGILALAREGITYEKPEDGYEVTYDHHQSSISGL